MPCFVFKLINVTNKPERSERAKKNESYLTLYEYSMVVVLLNEKKCSFLMQNIMSAYDITECSRTAYRPFAYID